VSVAPISVPVAFLHAPSLTASAKVLWLTLRTGAGVAGPGRLGAIAGLSHVTVRNGLAQLAAAGWYSPDAGALLPPGAGEGQVMLPVGLISDRRVRPHAKLLYGLLQTLPAGQFTHSALANSQTCRP
jgi:hypothetical protein